MSGLSLADMRRLGAERNQALEEEKPKSPSLLSRLKRSSPTAEKTPIPRAFPSGGAPVVSEQPSRFGSHGVTPPPLAPASTAPSQAAYQAPSTGWAPIPIADQITNAEAHKPLQRNLLAHTGVGAVVGTGLGLGATGATFAVPVGAVLGAAIGRTIGNKAQTSEYSKRPTVDLTKKQAPDLFERLERAGQSVQRDSPAFKLIVDQSAGISSTSQGATKQGDPKTYNVIIGLSALVGISLDHLETLMVHALVRAQNRTVGEDVTTDKLASLEHLHAGLERRSKTLRLASLDGLAETQRAAYGSHLAKEDKALREADQFAARYAGPRRLVEALLAQGLLAAFVTDCLNKDMPYPAILEALRGGLSRPTLDQSLRQLAQDKKPSVQALLAGYPVSLLDRLQPFDMTSSVPRLPAATPAISSITDKAQRQIDKRLSTVPKRQTKTKAVGTKTSASNTTMRSSRIGEVLNQQNDAANIAPSPDGEQLETAQPSTSKGKNILGGLFSGGKKAARLAQMNSNEEPLYIADNIYKSDAGTGLEAYQSLVDDNPRWALARLRLAEAQLEMGLLECVANLMVCAERLPSALPTILNHLQSAMAMVSPLDGEQLRQAIDQMRTNADVIAEQRAEIDLENLRTAQLDLQDQQALTSMFKNTVGLREAWVLATPCALMPEVPHHAILGLAPRLSVDTSQAMALSLAEHAAINGTVAVYVETGKPEGALGDALARYPSFWHAAA